MSEKLKRTWDLVNAVSPSFCAAKWYNASIWLSNGRTASCHHPLAHYVPTKELLKNPSALHNTEFKKQQRRLMLEGERPEECGYCWRVEDLNNDTVYSDRVYKSMIYNPGDVLKLAEMNWDQDIDPKTLEICFDNLCNLACSYCNSEFSSTWSTDIIENGPYKNMKTSGGGTFENDGEHGMPFGPKNTGNFYIKRFFEWWDSGLRNSLDELRVSGGEPSRSPDFWRLVERFKNERFRFAVNSNLMMERERLDRLIAIKQQFDNYSIYTSCEATDGTAEFTRSGLRFAEWQDNLEYVNSTDPAIHTHIMMTVSALSVWGIAEFLDTVMSMRARARRNNTSTPYHMSVNILRFPSFQSINIISPEYKQQLAAEIEASVQRAQLLTDSERNNYVRLVEYLRQVDVGYEDTDSREDKHNDFREFVNQYSQRRHMSYTDYMPGQFNTWFQSL